jgi:type IV fimbrial biogenesis protein FimT
MKTRQTGFTMIELMFTLVVAATLLAIGIPNFRDFMRNSRMASAANDLLADVALARSEAIKRRTWLGLCSSADPLDADAECVDPDDDDELTGWIVWIDDADPLVASGNDGDGLRQDTEEVLRGYALPESITTFPVGTRLSIGSSGFVRPGVADTLTMLLLCDARGTAITAGGNSAARGIRVSQTGRAIVTRDKTDIEANLGDCT